MNERCKVCKACKFVEATRRISLAELISRPGSGEEVRQLWNKVLADNPCEKWIEAGYDRLATGWIGPSQ